MSCVFQNIDPHPLTARRVCTPAFVAGGGHTRRVERGGSIFWKAQDKALYSTYIESSLLLLYRLAPCTLLHPAMACILL
jgi:hypothetical protein